MKRFFVMLMAALATIPIVKADILFPFIMGFETLTFMFIIPLIILESLVAYYFIKKFSKVVIKFWYSILIFTIANIISTLVGYLLGSYSGMLFHSFSTHWIFILPLFVFTLIIEIPIAYFMIKHKFNETTFIDIFKLLLVVNLVSYFLLIVIFFFKLF